VDRAEIVRDHHVRQDQAAADSIAVEIEAETVAVSLRANQITAATVAVARILVLDTARVDPSVRATMTTSAATSPATHHLASPAASDLMRMQAIDKS
jgi:hypothetical protein